MTNVTAMANAAVEIWPYLDALNLDEIGVPYLNDVHYVYRDAHNRFDPGFDWHRQVQRPSCDRGRSGQKRCAWAFPARSEQGIWSDRWSPEVRLNSHRSIATPCFLPSPRVASSPNSNVLKGGLRVYRSPSSAWPDFCPASLLAGLTRTVRVFSRFDSLVCPSWCCNAEPDGLRAHRQSALSRYYPARPEKSKWP